MLIEFKFTEQMAFDRAALVVGDAEFINLSTRDSSNQGFEAGILPRNTEVF